MKRQLPQKRRARSSLSPPFRQRRRQRAQTLVEYGIIIAMVSVVAILVLQALGTSVTNLYEKIDNTIEEANSYDPN